MWAKIGCVLIRFCAIIVAIAVIFLWLWVPDEVEEDQQIDKTYLKGKLDEFARHKRGL